MLHVPQRCRPVSLACHIHMYRYVYYIYLYIGIKNSRRVCRVTRHFRLLVWRTVARSESKFAACLCCCCRAGSAVGALHECIFICAIYFNFIKLLTGLQKQTQHSGEVGLTPSLSHSITLCRSLFLSLLGGTCS